MASSPHKMPPCNTPPRVPVEEYQHEYPAVHLPPPQEHVIRHFSSLTMHMHEQQQQNFQQQQQHHLQEQPKKQIPLAQLKHNRSESACQRLSDAAGCTTSAFHTSSSHVRAQSLSNPLGRVDLNTSPIARSQHPSHPFPCAQFETRDCPGNAADTAQALLALMMTQRRGLDLADQGTATAAVSPAPAGNAELGSWSRHGGATGSQDFGAWLTGPGVLRVDSSAALKSSVPSVVPASPAPVAATLASSFQVLSSSFWERSGSGSEKGSLAVLSESHDSTDIQCGGASSSSSGGSSSAMDREGDDEDECDGDDDDDEEADSGFRPLDNLPMKRPMLSHSRSLSSHFGGKSRTFTSLADVSGIQSIQSLAKPPPGLCLRRPRRGGAKGGSNRGRCLLGVSALPDARRGISKRLGGRDMSAQQTKHALALAVAMGSLG